MMITDKKDIIKDYTKEEKSAIIKA